MCERLGESELESARVNSEGLVANPNRLRYWATLLKFMF